MWYALGAYALVATVAALFCAYRWGQAYDRSAAFRRAARRRMRALGSLRTWSDTQALNLNVLWVALQAARDLRRAPPPLPQRHARADESGVINGWHRRTGTFDMPRWLEPELGDDV